jgi:uroporphyrinogen-III synthase
MPMSELTRTASLAGAGIVLTRPAGTAGLLASRVRSRGGDVVLLPGLALREVIDAGAARSALQAASGVNVWIYASPAAVRHAFRLHPGLSESVAALAFGVGTGSVRALARHGVHAGAPEGRSDSEGLLAMPAFADVRGKRIALIGAPGGRDLIAPTLRQRGAEVTAIHVYVRAPPRLTRRHFEALARAPDPLLTLLSSGEALVNLVALVPAPLLARLRHQILVVSSARLAALADEHGFEDIRMASSASPDDLLDAAAKALTHHRL